jgi:hypothetical protein
MVWRLLSTFIDQLRGLRLRGRLSADQVIALASGALPPDTPSSHRGTLGATLHRQDGRPIWIVSSLTGFDRHHDPSLDEAYEVHVADDTGEVLSVHVPKDLFLFGREAEARVARGDTGNEVESPPGSKPRGE